MFCPNCGFELADGAVFCGGCGFNVSSYAGSGETTVLNEQPGGFTGNYQNMGYYGNQPVTEMPQYNMQQNPQYNPEPPVKKKKKKKGLIVGLILLFLGIIVALVAGAGLLVGSFFISPKATADDFATKLSQNDTQGMYELIFGEGAIVTYEQFNDAYLNGESIVLSAFGGNENYEIAEISSDDTSTAYEIRYNNGMVMNVTVEKTKDDFLYFDEYRIVTDICPSYDVYIPDGAQLFVNDIEITSEPQQDKITGLNKYSVTPLLTGEYDLKVQFMDNTYEKHIYVLDDKYFNTITIDADEIEFGSEIKEGSDYTIADAEAFFGKVMDEYTFNSYRVVYYGTPESLLTYGIESISVNDYRLYAGREYTSGIEKVTDNAKDGILISDVMTQEEYASLASNDDGYKVYKLSEVQHKINALWGPGAISVSSLVDESDIITSKGFLLREGANDEKGNFDYYGKVKSAKVDEDANRVVIETYILKCDVENKKVYDEGTGLQIASGQVNRGVGVDFDAIVNTLKINTQKMATVRFSFQLSKAGVTLLGASENAISKDVLNAQNVVIQNYAQSCYMKVKAKGGLNMRYEPTKESQVIKLVPNNSAVEVRGYSSNVKDWVYVYWGGYEGWVSYKYLTPAEYTSQPSGKVYWYVVHAKGGLNMRAKDNTKSSVVKLVPDMSMVKLVCFNSDATWAYVTYDDKYAGWVNTAYIKFDYEF